MAAGHQHQRSSDVGAGDGRNTNADSVRRRISRACDQCNQLRTKCDGKGPCAHCVGIYPTKSSVVRLILTLALELGLSCKYIRERKKRGKASRKDAAHQEPSTTGSAHAHSPRDCSSEGPSPPRTARSRFQAGSTHSSTEHVSQLSESRSSTTSGIVADEIYASARDGGVRYIAGQTEVNPPLQRLATTQDSILPDPIPQSSIRQRSEISPTAMSLNGFSLSNDYGRPGVCGIGSMSGPHSSPNGLQISQMQPQFQSQQSFQNFGENSYPAMSPPNLAPPPGFRFGSAGESPSFAGFFGASPIIGSPGWLNLPSPSN